jgi:hypothetical protein
MSNSPIKYVKHEYRVNVPVDVTVTFDLEEGVLPSEELIKDCAMRCITQSMGVDSGYRKLRFDKNGECYANEISWAELYAECQEEECKIIEGLDDDQP